MRGIHISRKRAIPGARTLTSQHASAIRNVTNSNFGKLTGQTNLPRNVQIGLKLIF